MSELQKYHCVTQLRKDSWEYRVKGDHEEPNEDDLVSMDDYLRLSDQLRMEYAAHDKRQVAAAEQREQVDAERLVVDVITERQRQQIATLTAEATSLRTRYQTLVTQQESMQAEHEQRLHHRDQQIATLTAEVAHQITFAKELAEEYAALEAIADAQRDQIATLTANLATVREVWAIDLDISRDRVLTQVSLEIENQRLTAERDAARKLARQAANGWACYATRKAEHDEIARMHTALDATP